MVMTVGWMWTIRNVQLIDCAIYYLHQVIARYQLHLTKTRHSKVSSHVIEFHRRQRQPECQCERLVHKLINLDEQYALTRRTLGIEQMDEPIPGLQAVQPDARPRDQFVLGQRLVVLNLDA